ncbi:MAG TPA: ornithine carbamoyltransferase [Candidatus Thermoplasmatota archaeon]|nr:ornithine carbamoyltransferase [Candidatus Thermoplasmatota archaeon]
MVRHLLSMLDIEREICDILDRADRIKRAFKAGQVRSTLSRRTLAMIFEKPSTRTRVSFEVGMAQLGGHALYLSPKDIQLGRGETIADTSRVLSRYCDAVVYRAFDWKNVHALAAASSVPVINALDNREHPCQALADLETIREHKDSLEGVKIAYVGDGNNVCNSLMLGAALVGADISVGCPASNRPDAALTRETQRIAKKTGSKFGVFESPGLAAKDADVLYTDVWVSMGDEAERAKREKIFRPYQVNARLVAKAKKDAIVMHCLPAHRGLEITDGVLDGKQSVVLDQAENRLHAQKGLLEWLIAG